MNKNSKGIYAIINTITNKIYIGSTRINFKKRWQCHMSDLRLGKHHSKHLQHAYNKYGIENFKFEILEEMNSHDEYTILKREEYYIKKYKSYLKDYGYNMTSNAQSGNDPKLRETVVGFDKYGNKICEFECGEEATRHGYHHVRESCKKNSKSKIAWSTTNGVYFRYKSEIGEVNHIDVTPIDHILIVDALTGNILEKHEDFTTINVLSNRHKWLSDKIKSMIITPELDTIYCKESKLDIVLNRIKNLNVICVYDKNGNFESKHINGRKCALHEGRTYISVKRAYCTLDNLKLVRNKYILIFKNSEIPQHIKIS